MAANVETMFYVRNKPWHGLGKNVSEAPRSKEALEYAGLDWKVMQKSIYTSDDILVDGYKANIRSTDRKVLGVVTDRYKVVQNAEAFSFTDGLLGEGVRYETAGALQDGKRIWLLARLPREYIVLGDRISPYLVISNSHDGSGAIKVALTPIRVVCNNTLNLAINSAQRIWSVKHTGDMQSKMREAKETLFRAEDYMDKLSKEIGNLNKISVTDNEAKKLITELLPISEVASATQERNVMKLRADMEARYFDAPDLADVGKNGYRFINAVSDFATHAKPLRETNSYQENLFSKTIDGHMLIDRAHELVKSNA